MRQKTIPAQATIKKNRTAISDLELIRSAIYDGKLDDVLSLIHEDWKSKATRIKTMADIDNSIKNLRQAKVDSVNFAIEQVKKFSLYLRRNHNHSCRDYGYTADMILAHIEKSEFVTLAIRIKAALETADPIAEGHTYGGIFERLQNQAKDRMEAQ